MSSKRSSASTFSSFSSSRGGDLIPYEQVHGRIEEYLKQLGVQKRLETEVETLRTQGTVEIFI